MDKQSADKIITEYYKKLYGFALSKISNIDKAEELASQITLEVYSSLLRLDEIENVNGYIYRIACNVYAKFIAEAKESAHLGLEQVNIPVGVDHAKDIIDSETAVALRREISYLSNTQRKIVVMHFYENKKLAEIAKKLSVPLGTVKWHLYEAKSSLKEGINMKRTAGILGINPVSFSKMGHSGYAGKLGDTADFLKNSLTQNIVYSTYHEPKTVNEIAQELGVSPIFIEDEVNHLEEYGFLERLAAGKLRTTVYITENDEETEEKLHKLYQKYAVIICEKYIPSVLSALKDIDRSKIYIPDNDENLLSFAAVTLAVGRATVEKYNDDIIEKYRIIRPDGGNFIAWAEVSSDFNLSYNPELYSACGDMNCKSKKYNISSWQFNSFYDSREGNWRDNPFTDYDYLYEHISNKITKDDASLEKYQRLYEKGYISVDSDKVNVIVSLLSPEEFYSFVPAVDESLANELKSFNKEVFKITKHFCAPHMHDYHKAVCGFASSDNIMRTTVLELLVKNGILKLPKDGQKSALNTILFSDRLPG